WTTSVEQSAIRPFCSFVLVHRPSDSSVLYERSEIGDKIRAAKIAFLLEVVDATIESLLVFLAEGLARQNNNWNVRGCWISFQFAQDLKAIQIRHQQIQHNDVGVPGSG